MPTFEIDYPADKPSAGGAASEAGHRLRQHDGAWIVTADDQAGADACQAFLGAYDEVATDRADAKLRVKDEAQRRIYAVAPAWRQANATARGVELLQKLVTTGSLSPDEQAEAASYQALFARAKAIRDASNAIEAALDAETGPYALLGYDAPSDPAWPADG